MEYKFTEIEKKWQEYWESNKTFAAVDFSDKPKFYCLVEFPYPSGDGLHVGHPRSYTALDILARKRRMNGQNVLFPMGFDSFGLPSENYAIKTGIHPRVTTTKNVANFTRQLKMLGFSFDWDRSFSTTDPDYYRWTQWIFIKLYEKGLAYKDEIPINWCLSCKIGLANEEVVDGKCERCGGEVEKRKKSQWMLKITEYAQRLIDDLDHTEFLDKIKTQQINWIGRSEGAEVDFQLGGFDLGLKVFTTRPDTLFGATFMVISPEHPYMDQLIEKVENRLEIEDYIKQARLKSDMERTELNKEKSGVELKGITALNPVNGETIPVWVADYVLISYGTGAIMAVPAHDTRDWEFARKYSLTIREVISGGDVEQEAFTEIDDGKMVNSGEFDGMLPRDAIQKICDWLEEKKIGKKSVNYKLRDWIFSRQRYWGEPIPMVDCPSCGWVTVPEDQLPVELPEVEKYEPTDTGESPLSAITDWVDCECPKCGGKAKRETDTMPNWAGSSWYFLRYIDNKNDQAFADRKKLDYWMPVDWYNGGMEHTTLHVLYSRFWHKFLNDIGVVPCAEPYFKRTSHGMVLGEGGEKMSKSRGNVINPDDVIRDYGADVFRMYEMFIGPFDQAAAWDTQGISGIQRFVSKIWRNLTDQDGKISSKVCDDAPDKDLERIMHQSIIRLGDYIEGLRLNTAISQLMIFFNELVGREKYPREVLKNFLLLLSPLAPHLAEELWSLLGNDNTLAYESWPQGDKSLAAEDTITLVVQVNGKVRAKIEAAAGIGKDEMIALARADENIQKWTGGKDIVKEIAVPGKLVNIVVKG